MSKLLGYDFEIRFKAGTTNKVADALSRHLSLEQIQFGALLTVNTVDWTAINKEIKDDQFLSQLIREIQLDTQLHPGFTYVVDRLQYKGHTALAQHSAYIPKLI